MLSSLRRSGDSSNTFIGIILLIVLLVFIGPDVLPQLLANTLPFMDEGVPCAWLRSATDRSRHQSIIGRAVEDPLSLKTLVSPLPDTSSTGTWTIRVVIQNRTIGTVPIVFDPNQVILNDDGASSGVGLIFTPSVGLVTTNIRQNTGTNSFPNETIKLLGPRQRCVHRVEIPANQVANFPAGIQVRSYYRISNAGAVFSTSAVDSPTIFSDQGLAIINGGLVLSPNVEIPPRFSN